MPRKYRARKMTLVSDNGEVTRVREETEAVSTPPWARLFYGMFKDIATSNQAAPQLRVLAAILASVDWAGRGQLIDASPRQLATAACVSLSTLYLCASQLEAMGVIVRKPKPWRVSPYFFYSGKDDAYASTVSRHQMRLVK